eukprot:SM000002S05531  [mRNA]  locus=s2:683002:684732:+ [translate_table: standard]
MHAVALGRFEYGQERTSEVLRRIKNEAAYELADHVKGQKLRYGLAWFCAMKRAAKATFEECAGGRERAGRGDVVQKVRDLTANVTGVRDWSLYEPELQLVRYEEHEQYKAHFDRNSAASHSALATVLIYLNDDYCGGQTQFPAIDLVVTPVKGKAVVWRTQFDKAGKPDKKAEHAGLPVTCGKKYILTQWVDLPV